MKAAATTLAKLLDGGVQYSIPLFQRPYSWQEDEWRDLWEDIERLAEEYANEVGMHPHFIGSIVTVPAATSLPSETGVFSLIDGQQRLTTFSLILLSIAKAAEDSDRTELKAEIKERYCIHRFEKGLAQYKIVPKESDRDAFFALLNDKDEEPTSKITRAFHFFLKKINEASKKYSLDTLRRVVTTGLNVVSIALEADDNPYVVFESLNAKGKNLEQADLVCNLLFMCLPAERHDKYYADYWEPMLVRTGDNLTEFMRLFLVKEGKFVKKDEVYLKLKSEIKPSNAEDKLKRLEEFSRYYACILEPSKESNLQIRKGLENLGKLKITTYYPLLLNLYDDYKNNSISAENLAEMLTMIENFIIRRHIADKPNTGLNKEFPAFYGRMQTKNGKDAVEKLRIVLTEKYYPSDEEIEQKLPQIELYGNGDRLTFTRFILEALEHSYSHKEAVDLRLKHINIEHIFPQKPSETLKKEWEDDNEVSADLFVHTLGNLTLTGYNSELSNRAFNEKKKDLAKSNLSLNKYFDNIEVWDEEAITERARILTRQLLTIYPSLRSDSGVHTKRRAPTTKPCRIRIQNEWIALSKFAWTDALVQTYLFLESRFPGAVAKLSTEYPLRIKITTEELRTPRELINGFFAETHQSSETTRKYIFQALELFGLTEADFEVEYA